MNTSKPHPRLRLSHATIAVRDVDRCAAFYTEVLGFHVTDRTDPAATGDAMVFLSQDPAEHHQIVLVQTADPAPPAFTMLDHLAFRTASLADLRAIGDRLAAAGVTDVIPISHGNAWSLYFTDPEGNGVECFVDSPFHVAQPYADAFDPSASDAEIERVTRERVAGLPGFRPFADWRADATERFASGTD